MNVGDKVVYRETDGGEWRGTVAAKEENMTLLELDEPKPFLDTPDAIAIKAIDHRMYGAQTEVLGYGLRQALEDSGQKVPAGHFLDPDERLYEIDQPMKIAAIKDFCAKAYPGQDLCWLHGLIMTAVPINRKSEFFGEFEVLE